MRVLYISGSPRSNSNTDYLLNIVKETIGGGRFVKLSKLKIDPCSSCRVCLKKNRCSIDDDMSNFITPLLIESDAIVLGSPVYFNNVSAQMKTFIDRTWCLRGKLRNKIGGAVVVGRKYGIEAAVAAINAFFLKHVMIPANRGVCGLAYEAGEIIADTEAIEAAKKLGERIRELYELIKR